MEENSQLQASTLTCEEVRDDLYLFVTNELEDDESRNICAHLFSCKACREALSEHVKLTGTLRKTLPGITLRYYARNN